MAKIFRDNMGNIHIWENDDCAFERDGLHHGASKCDDAEADIFVQFDTDIFLEDHFSEDEISELDDGYPIVKDLGLF